MKLIIITGIIIFAVLLWFLFTRSEAPLRETDEQRAGRRGERFASQIIRESLNDGDVLLTNVKVSFEGKRTELDNVVVNTRGVFIIEVKNYSGTLAGGEDDFEWMKIKATRGGAIYQKAVKNPIWQVRRQVYILSNHLKRSGADVWVEGFVFLVERNSPVKSSYVLDTQRDINRAIHRGIDNKLSRSEKKRIIDVLS